MTGAPFLFNPASWDDWQQWAGDHLTALVLIGIGLAIANLLFRRFVVRLLRRAVLRTAILRKEDESLAIRRADTLAATVNWAFAIVLTFLGTGLVLSQLGLNVSALIASVGVVGIAIGLGAQTLVKDLVNGLFILLEDQYGVGDVVQVAGVSGLVIEINPRRTVLRDLDGNVHVVPNSAITIATNMTRGFSRINVDFAVAYEEDIDRVTEVVNDVCRELSEERASDIIDPPKVLRVDALAASGVVVKVVGDVKPFMQWELMGELRRRVKTRFDIEGIEIPYPHQTTVLKRADEARVTDERALRPETGQLDGD